MNTRVSVLTDKQAFLAGEQFVSPVMEKKNKPQNQNNQSRLHSALMWK